MVSSRVRKRVLQLQQWDEPETDAIYFETMIFTSAEPLGCLQPIDRLEVSRHRRSHLTVEISVFFFTDVYKQPGPILRGHVEHIGGIANASKPKDVHRRKKPGIPYESRTNHLHGFLSESGGAGPEKTPKE